MCDSCSKYRDKIVSTMKRETPEQRFWRQVGSADSNGCRMWLGARHHESNYGVFKLRDGRQVQAHAFACLSAAGSPLEPVRGAVFMHSCDVNYPPGSKLYRPCCEPSHLRQGTPRENIQDAAKKGRMASGSRSHTTRIEDDQIPLILQRLATGERQVDIAQSMRVGQASISRIKRGLRVASCALPVVLAQVLKKERMGARML
jgi:hypothetical protein